MVLFWPQRPQHVVGDGGGVLAIFLELLVGVVAGSETDLHLFFGVVVTPTVSQQASQQGSLEKLPRPVPQPASWNARYGGFWYSGFSVSNWAFLCSLQTTQYPSSFFRLAFRKGPCL